MIEVIEVRDVMDGKTPTAHCCSPRRWRVRRMKSGKIMRMKSIVMLVHAVNAISVWELIGVQKLDESKLLLLFMLILWRFRGEKRRDEPGS